MHPALIAEVLARINPLSAAFTGFAQAAGPVAITALWQSTAVAAGLALCLRLTPRLAASHRFGVWTGGFAVALGLQAAPLVMRFAGGAVSASGTRAGAGAMVEPMLAFDARWALAIVGIWLTLTLLRAADLAVHTLRLRKLWKNAQPIDGLFAEYANGRARVAVCTSTELDRPSVIGFFAPRILIPDWLFARLTQGELEQVILHECEHLRRRDDWTNLVQKLCLVLFPLNPALAWMEHRLCREREMACDEGVVRVTHAPRAYAACLASMAERHLEQSLARRGAAALSLGAFERRSELASRVHSILRRTHFLGPIGARAVMGVVGCGLVMGAVGLARSPQVVGFVNAPAAVAQAAPQVQTSSPERLVAMDRGVDGRNASGFKASGFRATNAMAVMPDAAERQTRSNVTAAVARRHAAAAGQEAVPGHEAEIDVSSVATGGGVKIEPRQQLISAAMDTPKAGSRAHGEATQGQWIVLTTWEQAEAPAANNSGMVADYNANPDRGADASNADGGSEQRERPNDAARPIAVTQLILRFYSASANPAPEQNNAGPDHAGERHAGFNAANSKSVGSRRAVLPLGDGWLVIQL
jgi:beta-lactamase regulating signal transducer with metallopeptidase domain